MKQLKFKHIRTKLISAYVIVFVVIMSISLAFIYMSLKSSIEKSVDDSLNLQIELIKKGIATSVDASIKNYFRATGNFAIDVVDAYQEQVLSGQITREEAQEETWRILKDIRIGQTGYVVVGKKNGNILHHPIAEIQGIALKDFDIFENLQGNDDVYFEYDWEEPETGEVKKKSMYSIYYEPWDWYIMVTGYREEFKSLVSIEDFEDEILSIKFGETGYPIVVDFDGTLVVHPEYKGVNMYNRDDSMGEVTRESIRMKKGRLEYLWKNPEEEIYRKKIAVFSEIEGFDMIVVATAYESEFLGYLHQLTGVLLWTLIGAIVLMSIMVMRLSDTLTRPILALSQTMDIAEEGDLAVRAPVQTSDELGEMSSQFNHFLEKLDQEKKMLIEQVELNANISAELRASISALKDAQEKILEEERFSNMGRMVTRISHHLNTPVGNAMMAVSFIEQNIDELRLAGETDAALAQATAPHITALMESSSILNHALKEAASIVDSFNKLNVQLHEGLTQHVNLCDFLKTYYYHQWRSKCPEYIQIHIECEDNLELVTSTNILELIFEQLTSNAIAHGFKDRDTGNIWVKAFQKDTKTVLIFEDDGVGIPIERSEYLFQPFFSSTENMSALGIGLNIVYNAVNVTLGGRITFEHRRPFGVRFVIEIRG